MIDSLLRFINRLMSTDSVLILKTKHVNTFVASTVLFNAIVFLIMCYFEFNLLVLLFILKDILMLIFSCWTTDKLDWQLFKDFCFGKYAAFMYLTGYLSKILPVSESVHNAELVTRIKDFEDKERVSIPIKKLFILIPMSGKTEPIICKNSDMIEKRKCLDDFELNRAGVSTRKFTNTVYRIFFDNKLKERGPYVSIVAEYASPLVTLTELINVFPDFSRSKVEFMVKMFYYSLEQWLIDMASVGDHCVLLYYDDKKMDAVTALQMKLKELIGHSIGSKKYNDCSTTEVNFRDERSLENDLQSSLNHRRPLTDS